MRKKITAIDLFCGAGGSSTGLAQACHEMNFDLDLLAINHWDIAISTHTKNHPSARHICGSIDSIKPNEVIPGGRVNLLVASPECIYFSNARGNKPINDQRRATPWDICNWLQKLYVENVLIENVKEFRNWGPLGANNRPLKSKRGETFEAFINTIKSLGYNVDHRILNAADYGDPTTRERLFIIARRNNKKIIWPETTHAAIATKTNDGLFGTVHSKKKWKAAREIIDWDLPSKSIFDRKKKLAPNTLKRIEAGLRKFGGAAAEPFIVILRNHGMASSINDPLSTVTGSGSHHGLVQPFIVPQFSGQDARSVENPLGTLTTTSRGIGLCQPFLIPYKSENGNQQPRIHSLDDPMFTVTSGSNGALIQPLITTLNHGKDDHRCYSLEDPMRTITSIDAWAMVEPYLIQYNGMSMESSLKDPLPTVTSKEKFALITAGGNQYRIDIYFRMLQKHELSKAMGFPPEYQFDGNREDVVKQIGNAVAINTSKALCRQLLAA